MADPAVAPVRTPSTDAVQSALLNATEDHGAEPPAAETEAAAALRATLKAQMPRVIAFLSSWDEAGTGRVSQPVFRGALAALGISASQGAVAHLVASLDKDRSGGLDYLAMQVALRREPGDPPAAVAAAAASARGPTWRPNPRGAKGQRQLMLSPRGKTSGQRQQTLREALAGELTRLLDLLKTRDVAGDGKTSRDEFTSALVSASAPAPRHHYHTTAGRTSVVLPAARCSSALR